MNNNTRIFAAAGVGFIIFTAPLFVLPAVPGLVITAYIAALVAIGSIATAFFLAGNGKSGLFVTTTALLLIIWKYVVLNILFSAIILLLHFTLKCSLPTGWFAIGHIVLAGITAIKLIAADAGKEHIEHVEIKVKESTSNWKMLREQTFSIAVRASADVRKSVESVRDAMRYADPVTSEQLYDIENAIKNNIDLLTAAVDSKDNEKIQPLAQEILLQIKQRSEMCKRLK